MGIRFPTIWLSFVCLAVCCGSASSEEIAEQRRRRTGVERGLQALARQQQKSGAWTLKGQSDSTAVTSLAVMAFLANGHVPGEGPYGDRLQKGIDWVLDRAKPVDKTKGRETVLLVNQMRFGPLYAHGIATVMLSEALGKLDRLRADRCRKTLEQAVRLIVQAQDDPKPARYVGGWRYLPKAKDSDLTVTGWQFTALAAARTAGIDVPQKTLARALDFIKRCQSPANGGFAYQPFPSGKRTATRTGVGVFCLAIAGQRKSKESIAGGEFLLKNEINPRDRWFIFGAHFVAAALHRLGAKHRLLRRRYQRIILSYQSRNGSWDRLPESRRHGPAYGTATALLALSVESGHMAIYRP